MTDLKLLLYYLQALNNIIASYVITPPILYTVQCQCIVLGVGGGGTIDGAKVLFSVSFLPK